MKTLSKEKLSADAERGVREFRQHHRDRIKLMEASQNKILSIFEDDLDAAVESVVINREQLKLTVTISFQPCSLF